MENKTEKIINGTILVGSELYKGVAASGIAYVVSKYFSIMCGPNCKWYTKVAVGVGAFAMTRYLEDKIGEHIDNNAEKITEGVVGVYKMFHDIKEAKKGNKEEVADEA